MVSFFVLFSVCIIFRYAQYMMRFGKKKSKNCVFAFFCTHLSLSLDKIGCSSAKKNLKTAFLLFSALTFHYLCSKKEMPSENKPGPIGVFDSGYGGLTILSDIKKTLPDYDYIYLGDNARAPYGSRSFEVVYQFTLQAVKYLFEQGCSLVILACNTASAKALRSIQQKDLPNIDPTKRVLGVIRPTVEKLGELTTTGNIGILGTAGTIQSESYPMEIKKMYPDFKSFGQACPMWVPLVEYKEAESDGADFFVKKYIDALFAQSKAIDTVILGCTHYPILYDKIMKYMPKNISVIKQGSIVAESLKDYLFRHPEMEVRCSKGGNCKYLTTEMADKFSTMASLFLDERIKAKQISLI